MINISKYDFKMVLANPKNREFQRNSKLFSSISDCLMIKNVDEEVIVNLIIELCSLNDNLIKKNVDLAMELSKYDDSILKEAFDYKYKKKDI